MLRACFFVSMAAAISLAAISSLRPVAAAPQPAAAGAIKSNSTPIPLSHVVLFSSGVGYFQRQGEIEGNAKIDLAFPATDVNDLIKSLVLEDAGGGKVVAVNYDSQDPIERTLKTFALDLTTNPSFGELLNQARGEKVEVTMQSPGQAGVLTGSIVGMESQRQPQGKDQVVDIDILNLLTAEGMRSVPLVQVQRVRFLNPALDAELRRALEIIASTRDHQKKSVSVQFRGEGKRTVRVGYVVESPMWKTSYRLALNADGKAQLQGWAVVENTTDDDWTNVKMALVSGRPISYQMDLYPPLYVPRPTVEPERFASLRPPTYGGALTNLGAGAGLGGGGGALGPLGALGAGGGFQGALGFAGGNNQTNLGFGGGNNQTNLGGPFNRYQFAGQMGMQGGVAVPNNVNTQVEENEAAGRRLTFEQLKNRKEQAKQAGQAIAMLDPSASVASIATAAEIGDVCQYVIDDAVNLPRQKSAMLPIVRQEVTVQRVSIFNESVHAKYPLLGVRFKNLSGQPLMQGPATVYDGATYAGDARLPDLQPGEERLLSYAIDLGVEVKAEANATSTVLDSVRISKGVLRASKRFRMARTYTIANRSSQERTVLVEHPLRSEWVLADGAKPIERTRDVYRFAVSIPPGKTEKLQVAEEQQSVDRFALVESDEPALRIFIQHAVPSPKLKESLEKLIAMKGRLVGTQRELSHVQEQLKAIVEDQSRLRANIEKLPPASAAYKRYLEKFDFQESEIEKLQSAIKEKLAAEKEQRTELDGFISGLTIDG